MPPQLDRITSDPQKHFGIPFIRDTGITVSEVVGHIIYGHSPDVLQKYPSLEPEDIPQALTQAVKNLQEFVAVWVHEQRTPVNSILGFSQLLVEHDDSFSEQDHHDFLGHINHGARSLLELTDEILTASKVSAENFHWQLDPIHQIVDRALKALANSKLPVTVDWGNVDHARIIRCSFYLSYALQRLISAHAYPLEVSSSLSLSDEGTSITVRVYRVFRENVSHPSRERYWEFQTAALIIHQHGGELKAVSTETGVTFEFTLPIYNETQPE